MVPRSPDPWNCRIEMLTGRRVGTHSGRSRRISQIHGRYRRASTRDRRNPQRGRQRPSLVIFSAMVRPAHRPMSPTAHFRSNRRRCSTRGSSRAPYPGRLAPGYSPPLRVPSAIETQPLPAPPEHRPPRLSRRLRGPRNDRQDPTAGACDPTGEQCGWGTTDATASARRRGPAARRHGRRGADSAYRKWKGHICRTRQDLRPDHLLRRCDRRDGAIRRAASHAAGLLHAAAHGGHKHGCLRGSG